MSKMTQFTSVPRHVFNQFEHKYLQDGWQIVGYSGFDRGRIPRMVELKRTVDERKAIKVAYLKPFFADHNELVWTDQDVDDREISEYSALDLGNTMKDLALAGF